MMIYMGLSENGSVYRKGEVRGVAVSFMLPDKALVYGILLKLVNYFMYS